MTDFEMRCSEKSVREYVRILMFGGTLGQALPMILLTALLTAMPVLGIIGYVMTQSTAMLILTGCSLLFDIAAIIVVSIIMKKCSAKLHEAYASQSGLVCAVAESGITVVHDNHPTSVISWDSVEEINVGKTAYFLKTKDNVLLILEKDAVLSGDVRETEEIIEGKIGAKK